MKTEDLRKKNQKELENQVQELTKKLGILRFKFAEKQIKDTSEIKNTKREIARIKTIIRELNFK